MNHLRAVPFDALTARAVNAATTAILRIVLDVNAQAVAVGQPCLDAWIRVGANAVLAEAAGTNHAAETTVVCVIQHVSTVAGIPASTHRLAGTCIDIKRLAVWAGHVAAAIIIGHITFTVAMRLGI